MSKKWVDESPFTYLLRRIRFQKLNPLQLVRSSATQQSIRVVPILVDTKQSEGISWQRSGGICWEDLVKFDVIKS